MEDDRVLLSNLSWTGIRHYSLNGSLRKGLISVVRVENSLRILTEITNDCAALSETNN